ncbi:MAG: selenocysteine-specific translation elongation factor [Campylobacter sp.]|nr:selenocysteine-specific translation elongation factor [Campylobacter sp.]
MSSIIIGTAGHIDHGKTSLIKAINGIDGDRMQSEKERGITIDLSFSNLKRNDQNIAFIDVPGHENLVKTMISGAYAFDACLLVVASDDGIMPQTREHIQILSLLSIKSIIVCITKCDIATKNREVEVENEIREYISEFENLDILNVFKVSIKDDAGIAELKNYLFTITSKPRDESPLIRYYVDRIFTVKGAGTIVTGSLIEGIIKENEKLFILDTNKETNVKSIEVHDQPTQLALSPNRVALNLSDISVSALKKGYILSKKGFFRGFKEADVVFYGDLNMGDEVVFCVGSKQTAAKAIILSEKNNSKFITFKFFNTMFLKFNEPFVVLVNSRVVGGGRVLNPVLEPLKKQTKVKLLNTLLNKNFTLAFEILTTSHKHGFGLISSLQRFDLSHEEALEIANKLKDVYTDKPGLCIYPAQAIDDLKSNIKFIISKNEYAVFSASSISLRINWASQSFAKFVLDELVKENTIDQNGALYVKKGVNFDKVKESLESKIYDILSMSGLTPDAPYNIYDNLDIDRQTGDNAFKALTSSKKILRLAHNLFITSENLNLAMKLLRDIISKEGFVNIGNVKDKLGLSRKYTIAYLEYLDKFDDITKVENDRVFA